MKLPSPPLRLNFGHFAILLGLLVSFSDLLYLLFARLTVIVQYVPDDAFYYLEISRNLARIHISTQDGGQTITSGYHLLWAWILEGIAQIVRFDRMLLLRGMILLSWFLAIGTVLAIAKFAWRRSAPLLAVLTLLITSQSFLYNSVSGLEWSLTVSVGALVLFTLLHASKQASSKSWLAILVCLGIIGSLSRSDYGGQAFCYCGSAFLLLLLKRDKRFLFPSLSVLSGAIVGLLVTFWHDWRLTGDWVQGSARMKSLWAASGGRSPLPFFPVLVRTIAFLPSTRRKVAHEVIGAVQHTHGSAEAGHSHLLITTLFLFAILVGGIGFWISQALKPAAGVEAQATSQLKLFLAVSAGSTILLYALVDTFNSFAIQIWYTSQITIAVGVLLFLMVSAYASGRRATLVFGLIAVLSAANLMDFILSKPKYHNQAEGPAIAEAMMQQLEPGKIGFSDSGTTNFAYGGSIINLDGLVNNEIIAYAPSRLPCYLLDKRIRYFTGFGEASMIAFHLEAYQDYANLVSLRLADGGSFSIYETDFVKLKALPACVTTR